MKNITLTLTEDELYAVGAVATVWENNHKIEENAPPEVLRFYSAFQSAYGKILKEMGIKEEQVNG